MKHLGRLPSSRSGRVALVLATLLALGAPWPVSTVSAQAPASPRAPASPQAPAPPQAAPESAAVKTARATAQEVLSRGVPGFAVAVAVSGKIVWSEGFGYADLEEHVPVRPTTKFRIGSVSKSLTAAALVRLIEAKKLDVDAPVQKYVPSFPDKGATITPRLLAGHLAGIRHYKEDSENYNYRHYDNVREGLKIFQDDPLVVTPGTKFSYSSYGYNLLSAVIESAAGEDFLSYMQRSVFKPLGLTSTMADEPAQIIEQRARFYTATKGKPLQNAPFTDNSYKWAGGGLLSTAEDLVRFGSSLLQPGFLKAESLALLFTSQKTTGGQPTGYGFGWLIEKSKSGKRIYDHSGGSAGATAWLMIYPDTHIVVALVSNILRPGGNLWRGDDVEKIGEAFERSP